MLVTFLYGIGPAWPRPGSLWQRPSPSSSASSQAVASSGAVQAGHRIYLEAARAPIVQHRRQPRLAPLLSIATGFKRIAAPVCSLARSAILTLPLQLAALLQHLRDLLGRTTSPCKTGRAQVPGTLARKAVLTPGARWPPALRCPSLLPRTRSPSRSPPGLALLARRPRAADGPPCMPSRLLAAARQPPPM
jgi:hypothetical protein